MLVPLLSRFQDLTCFLLRIFAGLLFACHGAQKLFGVLGGTPASNALMTVAGIVEFFGGLAIALGLLTQVFSFLAAGQMAVAYLMAHLPRGFWPIQNNGELALLYLFIFLFLLTSGGGRWSLDSRLFSRSSAT